MDALRLFILAGTFSSAMLGGLYAVRAEPATETSTTSVLSSFVGPTIDESAAAAIGTEEIPVGVDIPEDLIAAIDEEAQVIFDAASGVSIGPLTIRLAARSNDEDAASPAPAPNTHRARPAPARVTPGPRLDADPGRNVILTARGMMARGETVRGSCFRYLEEVFARAGNEGWRTRTVVHHGMPQGPYADLDLIRPGDWLYIVNNPDSVPMGTHSVLFVGWEDRANNYARTISHAGWGAGASSGRESSYDLSRTYRIVRPTLPR